VGPTRKTDAAEAWSRDEKIDSVEPAKYTRERKVWKTLAVKAELSSADPWREVDAALVS